MIELTKYERQLLIDAIDEKMSDLLDAAKGFNRQAEELLEEYRLLSLKLLEGGVK